MKISSEEKYALTTNEGKFDFIELDAEKGFKKIGTVDTDNCKVYSVCLLNSGLQGVSIDPANLANVPTKQTMILGCNRGNIFKYEKEQDAEEWEKTGHYRLNQAITDVLQIKDHLVLAVQEEGIFDFVDVVNFIGVAHYDTLPGLA